MTEYHAYTPVSRGPVRTFNLLKLAKQYADDMATQGCTIIADSVVDIGRFCRALSTDADGGWRSVDYPVMRFEVHDVAAYPTVIPGAVQHNAWWDAMALSVKLATPTQEPTHD